MLLSALKSIREVRRLNPGKEHPQAAIKSQREGGVFAIDQSEAKVSAAGSRRAGPVKPGASGFQVRS
jgi:hypothetical protein